MPYTPTAKSTFRHYSDLWIKRLGDEPPEGLTQDEWDRVCLKEAKAYQDRAEAHEDAIRQGYEAEQRFWAGLKELEVP